MNLKPGARLRHYKIESVIGRGGMGLVYRACDTRLNREVAIKALFANLAAQEEYVRRFFREAQAVARINHPNVVKIYEVGQEDDLCFIVMEYINGRPLSEMLEQQAPLPVDRALDIALQVASGLACTHEHEVLHRDIKSGNIMITEDGVAKLLDFGLARIEGVSALTLTGNVMGTLDYIAPEQVLNEPVDSRSDLYSFGVVLYEMLAGRRPFVADEAIAVVYQHINDDPVPPSTYHESVPPELDQIVMTLLAKQGPDRYQSAAMLLADLNACRGRAAAGIAGQPQIMPGHELPSAPSRWVLPQPRDEFRPVLVGREKELERLQAAVRQTLKGNGRLTFVAGGVGTGKTRIVMEVMEFAVSQGMLALFGSCLYEDMSIPYQPFVEALSRFLGSAQSIMTPVARARLRNRVLEEMPEVAELMPHIWTAQERARLAERQPARLRAEAQKQRLFQSILHLMLALAEQHGVVLCMDDLHWGDSGSVQLLHYLARQVSRRRLHLIVTYRPEDLETERASQEAPFVETMRRLSQEGIGETVALNNLTRENIRTLVESVFGSRAIPVTVSDRVYQETGGNPLFVFELLKWWRETGKLDEQGQDWAQLEVIAPDQQDLPPRIYDMIGRRLSRLEDAERELLEVAAVGGTRFDVDGLAAVLGAGRVGVLRQLHRLERRHGIISPLERGVYQFVHGKTREVLYHELPEALRQEYHAAWGRTLLARAQAGVEVPVEVLATHLYKGGDEEQAIPYLREAAEHASKVCAFHEAKWFWEKVNEVLLHKPEESLQPYQLEVWVKLGGIYYELGDWERATMFYKKAFESAQQLKDRQIQADALMRLGAILRIQNKWDAAIKLFKQSLKLYTVCDDKTGIASILTFIGHIFQYRGQYTNAKQYFQRALRLSQEIHNNEMIANISCNIGNIALFEGENSTAIQFYKTTVKSHRRIGNVLGIAEGTHNLGIVYERQELWDEALNCYRESVDLLERMGISRHLGTSYINYARVLSRTGDLSLAKEICHKGRQIITTSGNQRWLAEAIRVEGLISYLGGDWDTALNNFKKSEELCKKAKDPYGLAETFRERAYMLFRRGDVSQAITVMQQAEKAFQEIGAKADVEIVRRKLTEMRLQSAEKPELSSNV